MTSKFALACVSMLVIWAELPQVHLKRFSFLPLTVSCSCFYRLSKNPGSVYFVSVEFCIFHDYFGRPNSWSVFQIIERSSLGSNEGYMKICNLLPKALEVTDFPNGVNNSVLLASYLPECSSVGRHRYK